jgi:acylphosphatase
MNLKLPLIACLSVISVLPAIAEGEPMTAKMVHYSGNVQGVGFRATAKMIAKDFRVTGWVKNLADGRVQLFVEGTDEEIDKLLKAIRARWKGSIEKEQIEEQKPSGKFKSFEITRSS